MARCQLTAHKPVRVLPSPLTGPGRRRPHGSYSDGRHAGYFPRTLSYLLSSLEYHEAPLYIGTPTLLRGSVYVWRVQVVQYETTTTDRIRRVRRTYEASTPRFTFEAGIQDAAR